jgi:DNA-directed RNA polymerase subunit RPC12/RpoP
MENCSRMLDSSPLSIQCRRCGVAEKDDYEVVETNTIQSMRCASCGSAILFAVLECSVCGAETFFPWASQPASEDLRDLTCGACERRYFDGDANELPFA